MFLVLCINITIDNNFAKMKEWLMLISTLYIFPDQYRHFLWWFYQCWVFNNPHDPHITSISTIINLPSSDKRGCPIKPKTSYPLQHLFPSFSSKEGGMFSPSTCVFGFYPSFMLLIPPCTFTTWFVSFLNATQLSLEHVYLYALLFLIFGE